jgi:nucleoside-diphosphate-sugar epimerase
MEKQRILVAGAGGFIGGWLVKSLIEKGYSNIRAIDIKPINEWYQVFGEVENICKDLSIQENAHLATIDIDQVYNLAADMGGMGFIEKNKALCMLSVLINTNLLIFAQRNGVKKYFYASSACVYNQELQLDPKNPGLKESDAYPAQPEDGYGWEKLFSERMCRHFNEDYGLEVRIARFHNVYGPHGTYEGGREKAPAAICRKVARAILTNTPEIEIWGDGEQTRSFTYIGDTITGIHQMMDSTFTHPLNLGSSQIVSINELVSIVEKVAGTNLNRKFILDAPKGVRGRNSENSLIKSTLNWAPSISLETGIKETYTWIFEEISRNSS